MRLILPLLFVLVTVIVLSVVFSDDASSDYWNCNYEIPITVSNLGQSDFTNIRIQFDMSPSTLIDMGFMQADADDTYLQDGSTTLLHTALGLGTPSATWTGLITSLGALNQKDIIMYTGEAAAPARDQGWLGAQNDYTYAADDASLDLTSGFMLSAELILYHAAGGTYNYDNPIISKKGGYELIIDGTPAYVFSTWTGTGAAISGGTGTPNGRGYFNNIVTASSSDPHWYLVASPNDVTWIGAATPSTVEDSFVTTITEGADITSNVTISYRVGFNGGTGVATATPFLFSAPEGTVLGTPQTIPSAMTTYTEALAWSGGSEVELGILLDYVSGTSTARCSRLYGACDWTSPGTKTSITVVAATGSEDTVLAWFDGTNMFLDSALSGQVSGTPPSGACFVNDDPVYTLEVDAWFKTVGVATP